MGSTCGISLLGMGMAVKVIQQDGALEYCMPFGSPESGARSWMWKDSQLEVCRTAAKGDTPQVFSQPTDTIK